MNQHSPIKRRGSLLERASELYDFGAAVRPPILPETSSPAPIPEPAPKRRTVPLVLSEPEADAPHARPFDEAGEVAAEPDPPPFTNVREAAAAPPPPPRLRPAAPSRTGTVDREGLLEDGYILPDAPVSALAEEFRIIKRQLLLNVGSRGDVAPEKRQTILVCSAQPDEGKTFCALNLALSLAAERDVEALLVDGDFAKPEILSILGLESGPGLIDAISDPGTDPNAFVIRTDIEGLSVLPAGRQANNVTELLASARTRDVLAALTRDHPRRVVIFDSPPALMASPASVLAAQIGQVVLVVRADRTTEADLKEAVGLLSGCEHLSLLLNGAGFAASGRRFGAYYGYGE